MPQRSMVVGLTMTMLVAAGSPVIATEQRWACQWDAAFTFYGQRDGKWDVHNRTTFDKKPFGLLVVNGVITAQTAQEPMRSSPSDITCERKHHLQAPDADITSCQDKYGGALFMNLHKGEGGVTSLLGTMGFDGDELAQGGTYWTGKFSCTRY